MLISVNMVNRASLRGYVILHDAATSHKNAYNLVAMKRAIAVAFLFALGLALTRLAWQHTSPAAAADAAYKFKISEDHANYAAVGDPGIYFSVETVAIYGCS